MWQCSQRCLQIGTARKSVFGYSFAFIYSVPVQLCSSFVLTFRAVKDSFLCAWVDVLVLRGQNRSSVTHSYHLLCHKSNASSKHTRIAAAFSQIQSYLLAGETTRSRELIIQCRADPKIQSIYGAVLDMMEHHTRNGRVPKPTDEEDTGSLSTSQSPNTSMAQTL